MSDPWLEIDWDQTFSLYRRFVIPSQAPLGRLIWDCMLVTMQSSVVTNRSRLTQRLGREVYFPQQVHGIEVICVDQESPVIAADAVVTDRSCTVNWHFDSGLSSRFVCKSRSDRCGPCRLARTRRWGP